MIRATARGIAATFAMLGVIWLVHAEAMAERALLTVRVDGQDAIALTLDDLRAIGATELTTTTPWTEGPQTFTGVTGAQLAKAIDWSGEEVSAVANNDYSVTIPFEVFAEPTTLIAYENNGRPMPVRAKGPLWIVFPFDRESKYLTDSYRSYAVWGLARVDFR